MLSSITIKNFKAIQLPEGLTLNKLASVNYLVGKNGCGKSSVLEALHCRYLVLKWYSSEDYRINLKNRYDITKLSDLLGLFNYQYYPQYVGYDSEFSDIDLDQIFSNIQNIKPVANKAIDYGVVSREIAQKTLNNIQKKLVYIDNSAEKILRLIQKLQKLNPALNLLNIDQRQKFQLIEDFSYYNIDYIICGYSNELKLSSGEKNIKSLRDFLVKYSDGKSFGTMLVEEIDSQLHPGWHKTETQKFIYNTQLGSLLVHSQLSNAKNTQLLISTHSPFVVSSAAKTGDQKVYLIEGGTCKKQDGFEGYEVIEQSNKLLGCGFNDFHKDIVICEGKSSNSTSALDEMVYNIIFDKEKYLFVSAGGSTELDKNSKLVRKVVKSIFANKETIKFFLKDGDNKGSKQKTAESQDSKDLFEIETKFLNRYAIESYIYDPEVVRKAYPEINHEAYSKEYEKWCIDIKKILSSETNNGKKFDHAKLLRLLIDKQITPNKIAEKLARAINFLDTSTIYKELHDSIFSV